MSDDTDSAPVRCGFVDDGIASKIAANDVHPTGPFHAFRIPANDHTRILAWDRAWTEQRRAAGLEGVLALALSGGGANGAFGAGVMVGWTKFGDRPVFDVVTGVSTGALIAPFVFAGPKWDGRLQAACHDQRLGGLACGRLRALIGSALAVLFRKSLVSSAPLIRMVGEYVDEALLRAIATQHDRGRRLLVATTNLDTQQCVIWDLGAIAEASLRPGDHGRSLRLFRTVLVASASVPGLFPPTLIAADDTPAGAAEAHVDGCASTPLFMAPGSMTSSRPESSVRPTGFYLVVNGNLNPPHRRTTAGALSVMMRALDTMSRANTRAKVTALEVFAEGAGAGVACAAIPDDRPSSAFNFRPSNLHTLFELGYAQAVRGQAFRRRGPLDERLHGSRQGERRGARRVGRWAPRAMPAALSGSWV
jgi:predicted acylesterase/phospholipase RssA